MPAPRSSLIVSTYNRPDALAKVLQGVAGQTSLPDEVLVADDGSGEPTRQLVTQWAVAQPFPVHHVWHADEGFRKTAILNRALASAKGDYLVFLDGDCVPQSRFVEDHRALAERGWWVQGRRCFVTEAYVPLFNADAVSVPAWLLQGRLTGAAKAFRWPIAWVRRNTAQRGIIGCNFAAWRDDLERINGFDEEYVGWGIGEDSDVGTRLYHLGRPRKFVYGRAIVFHLDHPSAPKHHVAASLARLQETIRLRKIRCERGLNRE